MLDIVCDVDNLIKISHLTGTDCMDFNGSQDFWIMQIQVFLNLVDTNHTMPDIIAPVFEVGI